MKVMMTEKKTLAVAVPSEESSSLLRTTDPFVRALTTIMYGLVVHFGTLWMIDLAIYNINNSDQWKDDDASVATTTSHTQGYLLQVLFIHEYWVYLQHFNVFGNPLLQHLDRQYGIALLKSNKHWSIAGTLSAYWCRESLGMFLCLPFLSSTTTTSNSNNNNNNNNNISMSQYLILYSLTYHMIKSRGVRLDALRRYSPRFGIMRVVIDKFYTHSPVEVIVTLVRMFLQGFDTFIHYMIVKDLILVSSSSSSSSSSWFLSSMHILFVIWVLHAALNQYFRCSTASLMVQTWDALTKNKNNENSSIHKNNIHLNERNHGSDSDDDIDDNDTKSLSLSSVSDDDDHTVAISSSSSQAVNGTATINDDFVVRQLLHHKRVPDVLKGRQGAASHGVDRAIRMETILTILSLFYIIGLGEIPLSILTQWKIDELSISSYWNTFTDMMIAHNNNIIIQFQSNVSIPIMYAWVFGGMLYGIWAKLLQSRHHGSRVKSQKKIEAVTGNSRLRPFLHVLDLMVIIGIATYVMPTEWKYQLLPLCILLTVKSYLQSTPANVPNFIWKSMLAMEFMAKLSLLRQFPNVITENHDGSTNLILSVVSSMISVTWSVWVLTNSTPTPCEAKDDYNRSSSRSFGDAVDMVFMGHPAELHDIWALWMLPYSLKERWKAPFWTVPLWPIHYIIGWLTCNLQLSIFGDKGSYYVCDDVRYDGKRMQNWVMPHFGRHFVTHPRKAKLNIEAAARHAEKIGVKVLCLGALNKAESINGGGMGIAKLLGPQRKLSIIHGNHLTAAAVVQTVHQCFGDNSNVKLFLTGASSKVGWAVARALRDRFGYKVLCHSTDPERRRYFEKHGFDSASNLAEGSAYTKFWIVGKYDMEVAKMIPQFGTAIVFSVPHPLGGRKDVRVVEAGTLHMDLTMLDSPRMFTNKLKEHEIFACHAASVVARYRLEQGGKRIDEIGQVDPDTMDSWLVDARKLGFSIPNVSPIPDANITKSDLLDKPPPVIIIGAGPAGLCTSAYLNQKQIPNIILESQEDPKVFGSWNQHFTGLQITTQKKWSNLPGFSMNSKDFPNTHASAEEYQSYLQQYVHRFGINIRRGVFVTSIEKVSKKEGAWIVTYKESNAGEKAVSKELIAASVVVASGKHRVKNICSDLVDKLNSVQIRHVVHSTDLRDDKTWQNAIEAARKGKLCIVGLGNSAADITAMILQHCQDDDEQAKIHIAVRTIPPVFPRRRGIIRIDTVGFVVRRIPAILQEQFVRFLWWGLSSCRTIDSAFPSHLKRWSKIDGRVPVVDKSGVLSDGFQSGKLVGHGPIVRVIKGQKVLFDDHPSITRSSSSETQLGTEIEMVILATGYKEDCIVTREDKFNGLYRVGFGKDQFLPLKSISDEARNIAEDIAATTYFVPDETNNSVKYHFDNIN